MAAIVTKQMSLTHDYGANTTATSFTWQVPRARFIRSIKALIAATVGTVGTTPDQNFIPRLVNNITLTGNGTNNYFSLRGEDLYYFNARDYGTTIGTDAAPSATTTYYGMLVLDSAVNRADHLDFSALIPAHYLQTLDLTIQTQTSLNAANNADTVLTALVASILIEEVVLSDEEVSRLFGSSKLERLLKVLCSQIATPITAANSNYSGVINLLTGYTLTGLLITTPQVNATGAGTSVATNGIATTWRVYQTGADGDFIWCDYEWYQALYEDILQSGFAAQARIAGSVLWNPLVAGYGGINTTRLKQGDLQFQYNNTDTSMGIRLTMFNIVG